MRTDDLVVGRDYAVKADHRYLRARVIRVDVEFEYESYCPYSAHRRKKTVHTNGVRIGWVRDFDNEVSYEETVLPRQILEPWAIYAARIEALHRQQRLRDVEAQERQRRAGAAAGLISRLTGAEIKVNAFGSATLDAMALVQIAGTIDGLAREAVTRDDAADNDAEAA